MTDPEAKRPRVKLTGDDYEQLLLKVLRRDGWRCQNCGSLLNLQVHHQTLRSQGGPDSDLNLITLCSSCHSNEHKSRKESEPEAGQGIPDQPTSNKLDTL